MPALRVDLLVLRLQRAQEPSRGLLPPRCEVHPLERVRGDVEKKRLRWRWQAPRRLGVTRYVEDGLRGFLQPAIDLAIRRADGRSRPDLRAHEFQVPVFNCRDVGHDWREAVPRPEGSGP